MGWIKSLYQKYKKTTQDNKCTENLYYAKKYAILALSYWKDCENENDIQINIENSNIYVKLGK